MRKYAVILLVVLLGITTASSADKVNATQTRIWGLYLERGDAAAIAAMIPDDASGAMPPSDAPIQERVRGTREAFLRLAAEYAPLGVDGLVTEYEADDIRGNWFTPIDADPERVLLYLHGGAYVFGNDKTPMAITACLAHMAKVRCFSLNYPLAPEHPFPAAVENAVLAYEMLLEQGVKPENIVLGGDSAGGGLALALLLAIRRDGLPMPAGAYLMSPWADLTNSHATHSLKSDVDISLSAELLEESAAYYADGSDRTNPLISPVYGNLSGLPPLLIQVGSHERLLDDSLTIARNAALADVPITLTVWPGYPHVFQFYHRDLYGARKALREAGDFIVAAIEKRVVR